MLYLTDISLAQDIATSAHNFFTSRSSTFTISFLYPTTPQTLAQYYTACRKTHLTLDI